MERSPGRLPGRGRAGLLKRDGSMVRNQANQIGVCAMDPALKIVVASSGLGHVARGIEAWACDLASALAARGQAVTLCKGGGKAEQPFERVIPCWQREATKTKRLLRWMPRRLAWRFGLARAYGIEQLTFARRLIALL